MERKEAIMNQNRMPLYEAMVEHIQKEPVSFHVPGHKNGSVLPEFIHKEFKEFLKFDVTELKGLDDFHSPEEAIAESMSLLASLYGSYRSYFLVNGSTVGNLAMILGVCEAGDAVFVQRNCHKSILNALKMANVRPVYLSPDIHKEWKVAVGVGMDTLAAAFDMHPEVKACIFTYPNYYGLTYDIQRLIDYAHQKGSYVLVDEAHGAHFQAGAPFPVSALCLGADAVVHSAHKTLPAMTMGSYLHIRHEHMPLEKIEFYLGALQSSSPSYPIMASLDAARYYLAALSSQDIHYTLKEKHSFERELRGIPGLEVLSNGKYQDPLKITVRAFGYTGFELQSAFEKAGMYAEMADPFQVLLVFPLLKQGMEFPLKEKMDFFKDGYVQKPALFQQNVPDIYPVPFSEQIISFKELEETELEWIPIEEAEGRTSAKMIIPYPPGIPLFLPGEKIAKGMIDSLLHFRDAGARFQGEHQLSFGKIAVLEEDGRMI